MAAPPSSAPARPWLLGPAPDLLLGCGIGYAGIFVLEVVAGPQMRTWVPFWLAPLILLFTTTPHHGATLLRVYGQREERRAYVFFTLWATLLVWGLFGASVYSPLVGSIFLTVYVTWNPWHLTSQNYGIALMFLRRAGVPISPAVKRGIYASFLLSFVLTMLAVHGAGSFGQFAATADGGPRYSILRLGIPPGVSTVAFALFGTAYALVTLASALSLLRHTSARQLAPAAALFGTQALWFAAPVLTRYYGVLQNVDPLAPQNEAYAFMWISVGHAVQYLWITYYYANRSGSRESVRRHFGKSLLAGALVWTVPALVFAPGVLGQVPYDQGLGILIAAAVNLHHFVLDGAIWKLRDGRVARILLRTPEETPGLPAAPNAQRSSPALLVWAVGIACVLVSVGVGVDNSIGVRALLRQDPQVAAVALQRLSWLGRDSPNLRANLAVVKASQGDVEGGLEEIERSLALYPTFEAWRAKAWIHEREGDLAQAIHAYREALKRQPSSWHVKNNLAWLRATAPDPTLRSPVEAVELARAAAKATQNRDPAVLDTLAAAQASAYRFRRAVQTAKRAESIARRAGNEALAESIARHRALYEQGEPHRAPEGGWNSAFQLNVRNRLY